MPVVSACHRHSHDHDHDHEKAHVHNTNFRFTGYNQSCELLVEAEPLAVGNHSHVHVYLTESVHFKPLSEAVVTGQLIVGNKTISFSGKETDRKGIYELEIEPEVAGEGIFLFNVERGPFQSQIKIAGIPVYDDLHAAQHAAEDAHTEYPNSILFTTEQAWRIDFTGGFPQRELMGPVIKTTARVESSQSDESLISARTSGIVLFHTSVIEGEAVVPGQRLFFISGSGLAENDMNVRFLEAQSNYTKAKTDYERAMGLANDKIVSEKELEQTRSDYESARALFENLRTNFSDKGQPVTGSMRGFVKQLFVSNGQFVEAGQPLITISQNKTLLLKADVRSKYLSYLPSVVSAIIQIPGSGEVYSLEQLNGKMLSYGKTVNSDNYRIPVTFQVDNKAAFVSGGFVEVYIKTRGAVPVLTLPNESLIEEQGIYFVFVRLAPEVFEKREVKIGATDGAQTEIVSGISDEEWIVTKGAMSVKLSQTAGALDPHAGHAH